MTTAEGFRLLRECEIEAFEKGKALRHNARFLSFDKWVRIFQSFWAGLFDSPLPPAYLIETRPAHRTTFWGPPDGWHPGPAARGVCDLGLEEWERLQRDTSQPGAPAPKRPRK